ncbi:MAG: pilin [Candidatus Doudnabacteria bacterium]|nr:pilin [Candidatus Doudnabacteria bacterium]
MNQVLSIKQKDISKILFSVLLVFGLVISLNLALAQEKTDEQRCKEFQEQFKVKFNGKTVDVIGGLPACGEYGSISGLLLKGINIALIFAGLIAVVFIILGGFWFLTSAGNEETAEKGRKTLLNAVIGLVVIIMSFAIVRVVGNVLTNDSGGSGSTATTPATTDKGNTGNTAGGGSEELTVPPLVSGAITYQKQSDGGVNIGATINSQSKDAFKEWCGVNEIGSGNTSLSVYFEGQRIGNLVSFSGGPSVHTASVTISAVDIAKIKAGSNIAEVRICDKAAKEYEF